LVRARARELRQFGRFNLSSWYFSLLCCSYSAIEKTTTATAGRSGSIRQENHAGMELRWQRQETTTATRRRAAGRGRAHGQGYRGGLAGRTSSSCRLGHALSLFSPLAVSPCHCLHTARHFKSGTYLTVCIQAWLR
jgi:hypothetical protein